VRLSGHLASHQELVKCLEAEADLAAHAHMRQLASGKAAELTLETARGGGGREGGFWLGLGGVEVFTFGPGQPGCASGIDELTG
jgi:hypothetical protein